MIALTLPWPPKALSPNARTHWSVRSKAAKEYRQACFWSTKQLLAAGGWQNMPEGKLHLWVEFFPPDRRHRDDDNMIASFKAGRDGVAEALGIDDRRFTMHPSVNDFVAGMVKVRITGTPVSPTKEAQ